MALGLYKAGQGYWARVMTATMIGVVTLATAAWLYTQMGVVAEKLPRTTWAMTLASPATPPVAGERVALLAPPTSGPGALAEAGSATVRSYDPASAQLVVGDAAMTPPYDTPAMATAVRAGSGPEVRTSGPVVGRAAVDPLLLQGAVAGVTLVVGAVLAYWLAGMHRGFVDFLIAVDGEMKKVHWSTFKDIRKSTLVVIGACVLLSGSLFLVDFSFQYFFRVIGVLQH